MSDNLTNHVRQSDKLRIEQQAGRIDVKLYAMNWYSGPMPPAPSELVGGQRVPPPPLRAS